MNTNDLTVKREVWEKALSVSRQNPAYLFKTAMDLVHDSSNGTIDLVDVSNPTALLMEFSATLATNNYRYFAEADRLHYPILAGTFEDLNHHLGQGLYHGRFASPSTGIFTFIVKLSDVRRHAVQTSIDGLRKLLIPRGSLFQADGIDFTVLNAIEIRISAYDAIQAIYSEDYTDKLDPIESNILEYYFAYSPALEEECLFVEIPVMQVRKEKHVSPISHLGNMYNEILNYSDEFIQARVYLKGGDGVVREIPTTYSARIYDPSKVTARIQVLDGGRLNVNIPIIYYNLNLIRDANVIVEIYTTRGQVAIPLKNISETIGIGVRLDDDGTLSQSDSRYTAPWGSIEYRVACLGDNAGGANGVSFEQLKRWVIDGGEDNHGVITPSDMKINAESRGYDLITDVDNVTGRVFHATRELSSQTDSGFKRGIGCSIEPILVKMDLLRNHPHVNDHHNRLTILPDALYRSQNGITTLLHANEIPTIENSGSVEAYINKINSLEYVYSPFYYCLDINNGFQLRAYHMDDPAFIAQSFIDTNSKTPLLVSSDKVSIRRFEHGYILRVTTRSSDSYKKIPYNQLFAQLAFLSETQVDFAYINGEFIGLDDGNHVWEFVLHTTFDFDEKHRVILNNFRINTTEYQELPCRLDQWFHLYFGVYDTVPNDAVELGLQNKLGRHLLKTGLRPVGLAENKLRVKLGTPLENLWRNARTVDSVVEYLRHEEDVPLTYTENVYKLGENGLPIHTARPDGGYDFEILHRIGEVVTDEQGRTLYKHRIGDVVLNENREPVIAKPKSIARILDIFFLDGIYRFSSSEEDIQYAKSIPMTIVNWLDTDIRMMQKRLLEKTELYFSPRKTMGYIDIVTENSIRKTIFNRLPFRVKFYLKDRAAKNQDYLNSLRKMTSEVINEILTQKTVSKDAIEYALKVRGGEENILGVNVVDMGLGDEVNTFTVIGEGNKCSVRRKIVSLSDGTLKVREDISIEFINHEQVLFEKEV